MAELKIGDEVNFNLNDSDTSGTIVGYTIKLNEDYVVHYSEGTDVFKYVATGVPVGDSDKIYVLGVQEGGKRKRKSRKSRKNHKRSTRKH
jgi:hypothetical protein